MVVKEVLLYGFNVATLNRQPLKVAYLIGFEKSVCFC